MNRGKMGERRHKTDDNRSSNNNNNKNENNNHNNNTHRRTSMDDLENRNFYQVINKMYLDEETADVHFVCVTADGQSNERVPAHKLLLLMASDGFKAMFNAAQPEQIDFEMPNISGYAFREFLQFFYKPKIRLTLDNIATVMELAKNYGNDDHLFLCGLFLEHRLNNDNIVWGYNLAMRFGRTKMKECCEKKIAEHASVVLKSSKFLECERDLLEQIVQIDSLKCHEFEVLTSCLAWAKASAQRKGFDSNDTQVLRRELGDLLYKIRFHSISMVDFSTVIGSYAGFFAADEFEHIIRMIANKEFQSDKFNNKLRAAVRSNGGGGGDKTSNNERKANANNGNKASGNGNGANGNVIDGSGGGGGAVSVNVSVIDEGSAIPLGAVIDCNRLDSYSLTRYYIRPIERTSFNTRCKID